MPFMRWDDLEGAAFLYYYSRGVPLKLVAGFMQDNCETQGPRPIEDLQSAVVNYPFLRNGTDCDVPQTNGKILELTAKKNIKWKDFLAKLELSPADKALLNTKGRLGIVEETQRALDPPMTKADQESEEDLQFDSDPAFLESGYSDPPPRRYAPGALQFGSDTAFQGPRYSEPRSTIGRAASPPPRDASRVLQFGSDPAFQESRSADPRSTSGQAASTQITGGRGAHQPSRGGRGGRQ